VGNGGDIAVTMRGGDEVTFANVADGVILPIRVLRVKATGTTATDILAIY
jgi:hypothetical protein